MRERESFSINMYYMAAFIVLPALSSFTKMEGKLENFILFNVGGWVVMC